MLEIKESCFKPPDGKCHFGGNALAVVAGSHGEKKTPLTSDFKVLPWTSHSMEQRVWPAKLLRLT